MFSLIWRMNVRFFFKYISAFNEKTQQNLQSTDNLEYVINLHLYLHYGEEMLKFLLTS